MNYWSSFQLDCPEDFKLLEWIMSESLGSQTTGQCEHG